MAIANDVFEIAFFPLLHRRNSDRLHAGNCKMRLNPQNHERTMMVGGYSMKNHFSTVPIAFIS